MKWTLSARLMARPNHLVPVLAGTSMVTSLPSPAAIRALSTQGSIECQGGFNQTKEGATPEGQSQV